MAQITVSPALAPRQIDDFPPGCERSCEGSLHLRPGDVLSLTDGELAHLKTAHPDVYEVLARLPEPVRRQPKVPEQPPPEPPAAEPEPLPDVEPEVEPAVAPQEPLGGAQEPEATEAQGGDRAGRKRHGRRS